MKREVICDSRQCMIILARVGRFSVDLMAERVVEFDLPMPEQEHIRVVNGTAARDLRCDGCGAPIAEGSVCFGVSTWTDRGQSVKYHDMVGWEFGEIDAPYLNRIHLAEAG